MGNPRFDAHISSSQLDYHGIEVSFVCLKYYADNIPN